MCRKRAAGLTAAVRAQVGGLHLNSTHLVRGNRTELLPKRGIWEAEMAEPATQAAVLNSTPIPGLLPTWTLLSPPAPYP